LCHVVSSTVLSACATHAALDDFKKQAVAQCMCTMDFCHVVSSAVLNARASHSAGGRTLALS